MGSKIMANLIDITVRNRKTHYRAELTNNGDIWAIGDTLETAVGKLIMAVSKKFEGVKVKIEPPTLA